MTRNSVVIGPRWSSATRRTGSQRRSDTKQGEILSSLGVIFVLIATLFQAPVDDSLDPIPTLRNWTGEMLVDGVPTFFVIESNGQPDGVSLVTMPSMRLVRAEATRTVQADGSTIIEVPFMDQASGLFTLGPWASTGVDQGEGSYDIIDFDDVPTNRGGVVQFDHWRAPESMPRQDPVSGVLTFPGGQRVRIDLLIGHDGDSAASARLGVRIQQIIAFPCLGTRSSETGAISLVTNVGTPLTFELTPSETQLGGYTASMVQNGMTFEMEFTPNDAIGQADFLTGERPQTPRPPFPYETLEVRIPHQDGHVLAGELMLPQGVARPPVVVFITGSGPQDRDETLMGHQPFLVIADHLARNGIASLRCDDRGVGDSTGDFSEGLTVDFATDVTTQVEWLATRQDIDSSAIVLVGHSEGGLIAPIAAVSDRRIAFIVLMAGTGVDGAEILSSQTRRISEVQGYSEETLVPMMAAHRALMTLVQDGASDNDIKDGYRTLLEVQLQAAHDEGFMDDGQLAEGLESLDDAAPVFLTPWMRAFIELDPDEYLRRVQCPVLALNGSNDVQVIMELNLPAIERSILEGGGRVTTISYPGLNHLFQKSDTGAISEYAEIDTTFEPVVLDDITRWIKGVVADKE
ncbi:MAG: hypothetical protein CMJ33_03425 [Phycisphaerae bacterium]|nr:hypothetical protein [Phycisphaerae bacterium]